MQPIPSLLEPWLESMPEAELPFALSLFTTCSKFLVFPSVLYLILSAARRVPSAFQRSIEIEQLRSTFIRLQSIESVSIILSFHALFVLKLRVSF